MQKSTTSISNAYQNVTLSKLINPSSGRKPDYIVYYDPKDAQSIDIVDFLTNSLEKTQVSFVTSPPTDSDLKKIAYMMDIDDQKMLHSKGVLSDEDLKTTVKGDNDLIAQRLIENDYSTQIRPLILCPLKGEVIIQGTLQSVTEMIEGAAALAW